MHDLIIVGGGPVGAAAAAALGRSGLSTLVLEARPASAPSDDRRSLALSHGSRLILERAGAWDAAAAQHFHSRHPRVATRRLRAGDDER